MKEDSNAPKNAFFGYHLQKLKRVKILCTTLMDVIGNVPHCETGTYPWKQCIHSFGHLLLDKGSMICVKCIREP